MHPINITWFCCLNGYHHPWSCIPTHFEKVDHCQKKKKFSFNHMYSFLNLLLNIKLSTHQNSLKFLMMILFCYNKINFFLPFSFECMIHYYVSFPFHKSCLLSRFSWLQIWSSFADFNIFEITTPLLQITQIGRPLA